MLILADDFGYNDVGYHNPYVLTPNIDELARTGYFILFLLTIRILGGGGYVRNNTKKFMS